MIVASRTARRKQEVAATDMLGTASCCLVKQKMFHFQFDNARAAS
jgi:hypothetical protein